MINIKTGPVPPLFISKFTPAPGWATLLLFFLQRAKSSYLKPTKGHVEHRKINFLRQIICNNCFFSGFSCCSMESTLNKNMSPQFSLAIWHMLDKIPSIYLTQRSQTHVCVLASILHRLACVSGSAWL